MKNVLLTTLAVFLITVTLVGQVQCVLRAGRDNIMIPRKGVREELEIMHNQAKPVYARKSGYRRARPFGNENEGMLHWQPNTLLFFFSVQERAVFYKSCNLIGSESGQYSPHGLTVGGSFRNHLFGLRKK